MTSQSRNRARSRRVDWAHLMHLNPFPPNLGEVLAHYNRVMVPELNMGQLAKLIRMDFDVNVVGLNKIKGIHFRAAEIEACILELTEND